MKKQLLRGVGVLLLIILLGTLGIEFGPLPWLAIMLTGATLLAYGAAVSRRAGAKVIMINVAALCIGLAAFEAYLGIKKYEGDGTRMEGSITEDFTHPDDVLGYAPNKNRRVTARKLYGDSAIYDVIYTIDAGGLRIAPPIKQSMRGCAVFFGDSVTFGEGVNDQVAFPYRAGIKIGGEYATFNLAFSGYGPHQMLASLQTRRLEKIVTCRPTIFIYLTILEHIARVAGLTPWDRHGPRYILERDETVVRAGNFDTPRFGLLNWAASAIEGFQTWQKFFGHDRQPNNEDFALFLSVIREAAAITRQRYPASEFHVILWDEREDQRQRLSLIESNLRAAGIPIHRLTSAIPDFVANRSQYLISVHDMHPNARMHELLADYVADRIFRRSGDGDNKTGK
jgi:hypothetical protein